MPKLLLVTGDDPAALLRAASAPFCSPAPTSKSLPLLAVRQGGLRDAVHELAASSGAPGWFGKPIVVFAELPALFVAGRAPLDALERETLLSRILSESKLHSLGAPRARQSIVASLDRVFGDLVAEGVPTDDLAAALEKLDGDRWSTGRSEDVAAVYRAYVAAIDAMPPVDGVARSDGRDGLMLAARAIESAPPGALASLRRPFEANASPRSIDIFGLADLRRGWRRFLDALSSSSGVDELRLYLLLAAEDDTQSEVERWAIERNAAVQRLDRVRSFSPALAALKTIALTASPARIEPSAELTVTAAPDLGRELENVARSVKAMLVGGDASGNAVRARDIAVIARKARPYLTRTAEIFERYGIPTYARLRHTLSEVPAVAALLRLFEQADDGWSLRSLRELTDSPYFSAGIDAGVMAEAGREARPRGLAKWKAALDAFADARDDEQDAARAADRVERIAAARAAFARFARELSPLDGAKSHVEWIDLTLKMLGGLDGSSVGVLEYAVNVHHELAPTAPRLLRDAARVDAAALRAAVALLANWRSAIALGPTSTPCRAGDWAAQLERVLSETEISIRVGERGGVQLLEATAAEGQSWAHVFVVGMNDGSFPAEPGRDLLFTEVERQRLAELGLPIEPATVWRNREAALFRSVLCAPSSSLHLSHTFADATGGVELPSAYLDDVVSRIAGDVHESLKTLPGSRVAPAADDALWSAGEALRVAALAAREPDASTIVPPLLGAVAANDDAVALIEQFLHSSAVERERMSARGRAVDGTPRTELAHRWNGRIDDPILLAHLTKQFGDRIWSATQLETYGRCGFTFFGKYVLHVNDVQELDDDELSTRDAGTIMHAVLASTYERLLVHDPSTPLSERNAEHARAVVAEEVEAAFADLDFGGRDGLHAGRVRETTLLLQEYVAWEIAKNEKEKAPVRPLHVELSFGKDDSDRPPVALEHAGRTLRLRGQIDRVDELIPDAAAGHLAVVDHKLGGSALSPIAAMQAAGANIQLALYLAAVDQLVPGTSAWGGLYQIVNSRRGTAELNLCSIGPKGQLRRGELKTEKKSEETVRDVARLALSLVDGVLAGRFAARVPETASCLAYCAFRAACREERLAQR